MKRISTNRIHNIDPDRNAAVQLLNSFKKREQGGKVVFENNKVKITTYWRESKLLKHLNETNSMVKKYEFRSGSNGLIINLCESGIYLEINDDSEPFIITNFIIENEDVSEFFDAVKEMEGDHNE